METEEHLTTHFSTEVTVAVGQIVPAFLTIETTSGISEQADGVGDEDFAESLPLK